MRRGRSCPHERMMSRPAHCPGVLAAVGLSLEGTIFVALSQTPNPLLTENRNRQRMLRRSEAPRHRKAATRVLIVGADAACRAKVARMLGRSDIDVMDAAPDGEEAIRAVKAAGPDLVLVGAGADRPIAADELARRLSWEVPGTRVLVFGDAAAEEELAGAMVGGAAGYVRIDGRADRLDVTLRIALALIAYREVARFERGAS